MALQTDYSGNHYSSWTTPVKMWYSDRESVQFSVDFFCVEKHCQLSKLKEGVLKSCERIQHFLYTRTSFRDFFGSAVILCAVHLCKNEQQNVFNHIPQFCLQLHHHHHATSFYT